MKQLFGILIPLFIFSSCHFPVGSLSYTCGQDVRGDEMIKLLRLDTVHYTTEDSLTLLNIRKLIIDDLNDSSKIKVGYYLKGADSLTIDIYGVEKLNLIDSVACTLFNDTHLQLPTKLILFFNTKESDGVKMLIGAVKRKGM